jgi:sugar/nucleoside kinase (ribokinase family)
MNQLARIRTPDYVVIGHITKDITSQGLVPGGTALYSGLTAHVLGLEVGIYTSHAKHLDLLLPPDVQVVVEPSGETSTFKNIQKPEGRTQYIYHRAKVIQTGGVPASWKAARILHLGPIANEIEVGNLDEFPHALIGVTPQGWMRHWDENGKIHFEYRICIDDILKKAHIAVLSIEDVQYNEDIIEKMAATINILAVTEGEHGARVYWNGDLHHFRPPRVDEMNSTGAGDIFAASFFYRYYHTRNPWEAARFANQLASCSVTRQGLDSIPTQTEVQAHHVEILREN